MMNNPMKQGNEETTEETPQESAMSLWDWCIDSDDEKLKKFL
jgi:hypothetical protein